MSETPPRHLQCTAVIARLTDAHVSGDQLADALREEMLALLGHAGAVSFVLDMSAVTYLSSAGISPLLTLVKAVREHEGRMVLAGLTPDVQGVLAASRLISSGKGPAPFEHQPDVPAAIASLYGKHD